RPLERRRDAEFDRAVPERGAEAPGLLLSAWREPARHRRVAVEHTLCVEDALGVTAEDQAFDGRSVGGDLAPVVDAPWMRRRGCVAADVPWGVAKLTDHRTAVR